MEYISLIKSFQNNQTNNFNNFKTLNNHRGEIYHLSILKDGRLASSSLDCSLNIYKIDTFELQLSIKEHKHAVHFFDELNDGRIITCSNDKTINIIKLNNDNYTLEQKLEGHQTGVLKCIELKKNELISVSSEKTMRKWEIKNNNKFECTKIIPFQNGENVSNILKLNENEFVTSSYSDKLLKFWNSNDYSQISTINNIESIWCFRNLCKLEDDILSVGGINSKGFYLIKISTHQLIKKILDPQIIYSIFECFDGLFLCSIKNKKGNYSLVKYKYENGNLNKIIEKENAHQDDIYTCIELNNGIVASGGRDKLIKL